MNRTTRLRIDRSAAAHAVAACVLALTGCGGSVYSLGNAPPDGGKEGGTAAGQAPSQSSGGPNSSSSSSGDDAGSSSGFSFDDGGSGGSTTVEADASIDEGSSVDEACGPSSLACSGGATGYACQGNLNPENLEPGLSCSSGEIGADGVDYCCIPWSGTSATCAPDPDFPCDDNSYAYQCVPGNLPPSIDPKLSCGTNFVDSNGNNDFCCTFQ